MTRVQPKRTRVFTRHVHSVVHGSTESHRLLFGGVGNELFNLPRDRLGRLDRGRGTPEVQRSFWVSAGLACTRQGRIHAEARIIHLEQELGLAGIGVLATGTVDGIRDALPRRAKELLGRNRGNAVGVGDDLLKQVRRLLVGLQSEQRLHRIQEVGPQRASAFNRHGLEEILELLARHCFREELKNVAKPVRHVVVLDIVRVARHRELRQTLAQTGSIDGFEVTLEQPTNRRIDRGVLGDLVGQLEVVLALLEVEQSPLRNNRDGLLDLLRRRPVNDFMHQGAGVAASANHDAGGVFGWLLLRLLAIPVGQLGVSDVSAVLCSKGIQVVSVNRTEIAVLRNHNRNAQRISIRGLSNFFGQRSIRVVGLLENIKPSLCVRGDRGAHGSRRRGKLVNRHVAAAAVLIGIRLEQRAALDHALDGRAALDVVFDAGAVAENRIEHVAHLGRDRHVDVGVLQVAVERPHPVRGALEGVAHALRVAPVVDVPEQAGDEALFGSPSPSVLCAGPPSQALHLVIRDTADVRRHRGIQHHQANGVADLVDAGGEVGIGHAGNHHARALAQGKAADALIVGGLEQDALRVL